MATDSVRLEELRKREVALRAAIAQEKVRQQKRREKEDVKLCALVGTAMVRSAEASPDLMLMLRQILTGAVTDQASRRFLEERGFI